MRTDRPETAGGGTRSASGRGISAPRVAKPPVKNTSATPKKLYHGSNHPFKPGDTVKPKGRSGGASSTPDYAMAKNYAKTKSAFNTPTAKAKGSAPKVFEVKPIGKTTTGRYKGKEILSEKGYKVVGEAKPTTKMKAQTALKPTTPKVPKKKTGK